MAIDFRIRDFFHPVGIYRLRRTLEQTQWLSPDELQAYQMHRLKMVIEQAHKQVPYYQNLFKKLNLKPADIQGLADLKKLPLLSKAIVREESSNLMAANASRYKPIAYTTTGTTGTPLKFYLDKNANMLEFVYYWRHWSWAGYRLGDCFAELGSEYFLLRDHLSDATSSWQPHFRRLMLNSGQVAVSRAAEMAAVIRKYRPKFLKGLASAIYFTALCLKEAGINDLSFKAIFSTGEVLTPQYRTMAESVFHCPVLDSYGHMERTVGISQCMQGGYHINSDYGLLELIHPQTTSDEATRLSQAIGTSLYNLAMPLIRYDLGDSIEHFVTPEICPCGRTLPLIKAIHGRNEDTIVTPDGRFITSMFIVPELVEGIRFVQIIQDSQTSLQINVVPNSTWDENQEEKLKFYAAKLAGTGMNIAVHQITPDHIIRDASGKVRSVVSCLTTG